MQMCLGSAEAPLRKMLPYHIYEQILPHHLLLYNLLEVDFSVEKRTKQGQRKKIAFSAHARLERQFACRKIMTM